MKPDNVLHDPRVPSTPALREGLTRSDMRSVLAVPLRVRGEVKGVLAIADRTGRRFAERHVRMLQMLADLVAVAVENAQHYRAVQQAYVIMPSMNGAELARRLRVRRPTLRVLFMSGYTDDVLGRQGTLAPGTDLLPKPFSRDDLLRKVREVLDTAITA